MFLKFASPVVFVLIGIIAGIALQEKVFSRKIEIPKPAPCPACNCPEAVSIQPFDVEKIKNLKQFTYAPEFTGTVSVAGVDSSTVRKYIDQSVMRAFEKHVTNIDTDKKPWWKKSK